LSIVFILNNHTLKIKGYQMVAFFMVKNIKQTISRHDANKQILI
jgi:hypothetical protein